MNTIDVIVVLVVVLNGIIGAYKGFVWQALRLASIVLGILLARSLGPSLAVGLESWMSWDPTGCRVIAYITVFAATYLLVTVIGHMCRKWIDKARLTSTDRSLGFILGSAKGLLLVWVIFYFVLIFFPVLPDYARTQLRGDPAAHVPPSKSFRMWDRWVRSHLDTMMPQGIQKDMVEGSQEFGR